MTAGFSGSGTTKKHEIWCFLHYALQYHRNFVFLCWCALFCFIKDIVVPFCYKSLLCCLFTVSVGLELLLIGLFLNDCAAFSLFWKTLVTLFIVARWRFEDTLGSSRNVKAKNFLVSEWNLRIRSTPGERLFKLKSLKASLLLREKLWLNLRCSSNGCKI